MRAEVIRPDEIDAGLTEKWRAFQAADRILGNPFYSPEFTRAVGAARDDARVAVLMKEGSVVGFLPHHRVRPGVAKPIGGQINDYHGVIAAAGAVEDPEELLRATGLVCYDFNHAPMSMRLLAGGVYTTDVSPYMDLEGGYEGYLTRLSKVAKHTIKQTERRIRKITREVGPIRYVRNDRAPEAWAEFIRMKNESFVRKKSKTVLDLPWVAATLEQLRAIDTPDFAGLLTSIYSDDRLVATHFGMRANGVWAWWFNTFDPTLKAVAPGMINIVEAARRASEENVHTLDFGKGEQQYKRTLASGSILLGEGSIERSVRPSGLMRQGQKLALRMTARVADERLQSLAMRATRKLVGGSMHLPV